MDVTHCEHSGKLKFLHGTIEIYSGLIHATALTGEAVKHVKKHLLSAFAALGLLQPIKADGGPIYTSESLFE